MSEAHAAEPTLHISEVIEGRQAIAHASRVIILVADGARPDRLHSAIADGAVPNMARLRDEGGLHTLTSSFPSVTGPAYAPFLMGRSPGPVGLPGLRWFDRSREVCSFPDYARSYVGHQLRHVDTDLDATTPTIFELCPNSVAGLSVIYRGLSPEGRIGGVGLAALPDAVRAAGTHFRGNLRGWLAIDAEVCDRVMAKVRERRPRFVFAALTGVDKASHAEGHEGPLVLEALRIVDDMAGRLRREAESEGTWEQTALWIVSDHGHSRVRQHEDLAAFIARLGYRVLAHPWVYTIRPNVAVMVSGNAMAHAYVDLRSRTRVGWPALAARWGTVADTLLDRDAVDLMLLPDGRERCTVRTRDRGTALIERSEEVFSYHMLSGDPLGVGRDLDRVTADAAYEATIATDYPDSIVQIARLAGADRSGDIIMSAARDWDFRARYEPIPHVSSHGALHREHMLVPLLVNRPIAGVPRRTVDVMPSAVATLGLPMPSGLEGRSFV